MNRRDFLTTLPAFLAPPLVPRVKQQPEYKPSATIEYLRERYPRRRFAEDDDEAIVELMETSPWWRVVPRTP